MFVSDRTAWWNVYLHEPTDMYCISDEPAEYGMPLWVFSLRSLVPLSENILLAVRKTAEGTGLVYLDCEKQLVSPCNADFSSYNTPVKLGDSVVFIGGRPDGLSAIVHLDLASGSTKELRTQGTPALRKKLRLAATNYKVFQQARRNRFRSFLSTEQSQFCS